MQKIEKSFENIIKKKAFPPSMLFTGPSGSGKSEFAVKLMMVLNCTGEKTGEITPCGRCRNCRRINQLLYPDFIIIEPYKKKIKVEEIRALKSTLSMKPFEARERIVLIKDADCLGRHSGNALLKMMEEPPSRTHFILTSTNYADILQTIRSRCYCIKFFPEHIKDSRPFDLDSVFLHSGQIFFKKKDIFIKIIQKLIEDMFQTNNIIVFASEYISQKKDDVDLFLSLMTIVLRDIIVYKHIQKHIYIENIKKTIEQSSKKIENKKLFKAAETIISTHGNLESNVNIKTFIESLLLKIQVIINEDQY
ncbi:MAG: hypothetical protein CSB21_03010 [Deltaproteobacteria bacterium]|nr:MAG: hypothetical protein CSB21_03010 [Deltaproteobacteria bacterium]